LPGAVPWTPDRGQPTNRLILRICLSQLGPLGVQVVGVNMGYVVTDMAVRVEAAKTSPADIVRQVLDGIESGVCQIVADHLARVLRANLNQPVVRAVRGSCLKRSE
jgi:hypothetical protein